MDVPYTSERTGASAQGAQWVFGSSKFTDEDHARIQEALNTALSWEQINSRQGCGGKRVHYLAGHTVVENANKIFGFNGWDSSILHLSVDYVEKTSDGKWAAAATAIVRVALKNGVGHEDVGNAHLKDKDKGEVLEKAKKAAVTDATKRALRLFGEHLGGNMSNKEGLKGVERNHKQNQRALKARQEHEPTGRLANASPPPRPPQHPPQQHPHQQKQQQEQPIRACKVETSLEDRVAGRGTPPVRAIHESHQNALGPPRPDHATRHPPPQPRHQPQTPRQQQQQQQRRHQQQPQGAADPRSSITSPEKPHSSCNGGVLNSSPRVQSPRGGGTGGDHCASSSIPSDPTPGRLGRTQGESSPNQGVPTAAIDAVRRRVSAGGGVCGGGGPSGSITGAGGGDGASFLHNNSPVFEYSLVGAGATGTSVSPPSAARSAGSALTGSGAAPGSACPGSKGVEDDFGLSQDYASAFLEIDSAIQRHTTSLSSGSCGSTGSGSEVGARNGSDNISTRQQPSSGSTGVHNGGGRIGAGEGYSERAIPQGQLAGKKRFRA